MSSFVSWCCSDNLSPPGLAQYALLLFLVHLLLLCVDRTTWCCCTLPDFGLSCLTMGQRTGWKSYSTVRSCQGLLCLLPFRDSGSLLHHVHTDAWSLWEDASPSHTFKPVINVSLCLWPSSGPQGSR